jgi:monofunctional biosynthetic peptidoglycan transglycosylase
MISSEIIVAGGETVSGSSGLDRILFDFRDKTQAEHWVAINDNVMGGVSQGSASITEDSCLSFSGAISLENNGGFASIRTSPRDFDLAGYTGIRITVKGDGRVYQFRLRPDRNFDGVAFKQEFRTTADTWLSIDLPFASFQPTYRGRVLQDVKPIVAADIRQIGFLIADKAEGRFGLLIDEIRAYK